ATAIILEEQASDHFASGVKARDRTAETMLDLGLVGDFQTAEGKGYTSGHVIGMVWRLVDRVRPVGLVDLKPRRCPAIKNVGIEGRVSRTGGVEFSHRPEESCGFHIL